jgi:hypothetical protein
MKLSTTNPTLTSLRLILDLWDEKIYILKQREGEAITKAHLHVLYKLNISAWFWKDPYRCLWYVHNQRVPELTVGYVGFKVLTAMIMKSIIFWDITKICQR